MSSRLGVALAVLLVALAGCAADGNRMPEECSDWTDESVGAVEAHIHVRNEAPSPACLKIHLAGEDVAKVPMAAAGEGEVVEDRMRTAWTPQPQVTVRAGVWGGGLWETETVDLRETPHVVVTVGEEAISIEPRVMAPD